MKLISRSEARGLGLRTYYTGKPCKNGHLAERSVVAGVCCECNKQAQKSWYHKNRKDRDWKKERIIKNVRNRALSLGREFDLTVEDLEWPDFCPVLGIPLDYSGESRWNQVSIDRTDSSVGYVKGNCVVMSMRANSLKQDTTLDEAKRLYDYLQKVLKP